MIIATALTIALLGVDADASLRTERAQPALTTACAMETSQHVTSCGMAEAGGNRTHRRKY